MIFAGMTSLHSWGKTSLGSDVLSFFFFLIAWLYLPTLCLESLKAVGLKSLLAVAS